VKLAGWMENDDRCLYTFIGRLEEKLKRNKEQEPTKTEMTIITIYKMNYVEVRLTNQFIIDVSSPLIKFLDFFESSKVRIHMQFRSIVNLTFNLFSKFLKNAGLNEKDSVTGKTLLTVEYKDPMLQLSDGNIFLGPRVETFLKTLKLTRESKEIKPWLVRVRLFYHEAMRKVLKYFRPSLESKSLQYIGVLCPAAVKTLSLDDQKRRWKYLAGKFPNIIPAVQVHFLVEEVVAMKAVKVLFMSYGDWCAAKFNVQMCRS
jgi:hypothetical protein